MIEPTGRVVVLIRDTAGVQAIVGQRTRGGQKAPGDVPPYVLIRRLSSVDWIGSPSTEAGGVQTIRMTALCYAQAVANGEQLAFALAGAVHDAINDHELLTFAATGGRGVIWRIQADSIGPALKDEVTEEPFVPVTFSVLAGTQVFAA